MKRFYHILFIACIMGFSFSELLLIKSYINQRKELNNCREQYKILKNSHEKKLLKEKFQGIDIPLKEDINKKLNRNFLLKNFSLIIYFSMNDCATCINEKLISLGKWQFLLNKYGCNVFGVTGIDSLGFLPNLRDALNIQFPIYQINGFEKKMATHRGLLTPFVFFAYGKNLKAIYFFNSQISEESFQEFLIKIKSIIHS